MRSQRIDVTFIPEDSGAKRIQKELTKLLCCSHAGEIGASPKRSRLNDRIFDKLRVQCRIRACQETTTLFESQILAAGRL